LKLSPVDALLIIHVNEFAARKLFAYGLASLKYLLYLEYKPVKAEHETAEDRTGQGVDLTAAPLPMAFFSRLLDAWPRHV
jgi:hypothetical protein